MKPNIPVYVLFNSALVLANIVFPKPEISCNPGVVIHGYTGCQTGQTCGPDGICLYPSSNKLDPLRRAFSPDGKCGAQNGGLECDPKSTVYKGTCCSQYGWCGETQAHCGTGCQSGCKKPSPPATGSITKDGRCGKAFGNTVCGNWPYGGCCSAMGYCGVTQAHCDTSLGCQSGCKLQGRATSSAGGSEPKITAIPGGGNRSGPLTTDGTCGANNGGTICGNWPQGLPKGCCSMYGFCGSSSAHCGVGCQSGQCDNSPISPAPGPVPARKGTGTRFTYIGEAGVPAMHAALMPNGKVVFLDKVENYSQLRVSGTGQYAYSSEFDPNTGRAVPLAYKTNAFCSGGTFLADSRLLNVGGNGPLDFIDPTVTDGFSGLRYLRRNFDSDSFNGENWNEPGNKLASPRWYASVQTLPDGRIFVASGSINGLDPTVPANNNPTYEILSPQGITNGRNIPMRILEKAQPYYMYPFIHTLRDGNLFFFVSKSAQIFNVGTNTVVRDLPDLPGEFRSYPNTGTSVLLPLSNADGYLSKVLVCGGGAYQDITSPTDASCGLIVADNPGAQWSLESMPQGRVMVEGLLLADGKVLLINGANKGAQGFDLATDPTFTPLIYDPSLPVGQRFTEYPAADQPIPRLYHSVALLLLDGTVLIAGSNPVEQPILRPNAQHPYVTDFRVERWTPPYLVGENANRRPRNIRIPNKTMSSDTVYTLEFDAIDTSKHIKVVLYHGGFVTHSVHMGHRMVFMDYSGFKKGVIHQNIRFRIPPKNVAQPGPWVIYVLLDGIPGIGQFVSIH